MVVWPSMLLTVGLCIILIAYHKNFLKYNPKSDMLSPRAGNFTGPCRAISHTIAHSDDVIFKNSFIYRTNAICFGNKTDGHGMAGMYCSSFKLTYFLPKRFAKAREGCANTFAAKSIIRGSSRVGRRTHINLSLIDLPNYR